MPNERETAPPRKPQQRPAAPRPEQQRYSHPGREPSDPDNPKPQPRIAIKPMRERAASDAGLGEVQRQRDEQLMRAMAAMEGNLLAQIAEAKEAAERAEQKSMRPAAHAEKGDKGEPGKPASLVSSMPAILMALAALVTAFGAFTRKDSDESATVYKELKTAVEAQNAALQKNTANDEARWNWIAGFVKSLPGVKVVEQPGAPPIEPLDLAPAPVVSPKTGRTITGAPPIQVKDPLPAPLPSARPVQLPPPEKLFGDKKP